MIKEDLCCPAKKHFIPLLTALIVLFTGGLPLNAGNNPDYHDVIHRETAYRIGEIQFKGNRVTKDHIIFREIIFAEGDTLSGTYLTSLLTQSRQNLLNTALFNFVDVEASVRTAEIETVDIIFYFIERWYIWPVPVVEMGDRNFNEWWETRDFGRLNYGFFLNHNNFRGRREMLQALVLLGYSQSVALLYQNPNINRSQTAGLGFSILYHRKRETPYATQNDKLAFYDNPDDFAIRSFVANMMFYYRPHIHQSHSFWLQFNQLHISDSLQVLNPAYFPVNSGSPGFLSLIYEYRSDHRNLKYYPTDGYYFDMLIAKHGLRLLQNNDLNVLNVSLNYKKYTELHPRWYLLAGAGAKMSFAARRPYVLDPSLGYMYDFVRGYEYYVINGRYTGLLKSNLKYQLMAPRIINLSFIPTEKFSKLHLSLYLGIHSDLGYVYEPENNNGFGNRLPNTLLWGNGFGFDVVTYYDRVLRLEYSVNRLGEHGLFVHFLAPI